jgi:hypothetical protein
MCVIEFEAKYPIWSVCIVLVLCLTASCSIQKRQEVKEGLNTSVNQLPKSNEFETVTVLSGESSSKESCYYAEAYILLGTSLPADAALTAYVAELQALGWRESLRKIQNDRVLTRGTQERIAVTTNPRWYIEDDEYYLKAKDTYRTIIFVSLWFYVPQRDGC